MYCSCVCGSVYPLPPSLFLDLFSSLTGVSLYSASETRTQVLDPDRWAQRGCIVYHEKDISGATVVENLSPDTLHRPVVSLTERGSSLVPSARRPLGQCRLRRRLLGLWRRHYDGQSRVVVSNWRSRLTRVAWAAPMAALCALVTRDQQYSLAKVASGSAVAERTYVPRIECGRWRVSQ